MKNKMISILISVCFSTALPAVAEKPSFDQYVEGLKKEGIEKGFDAQLVNQAFANLNYRERAVKADRNQPEKKLTLDEYIPRAVPNWKVKKAQKLYQENRADLERLGKKYGVQPRFIVALWGVESNFGALMGNFNVIEALSTMAYEGRREEFFVQKYFKR